MSAYDDWTAEQDSTTVTVDGHDLEVAYLDKGSGDPVVFLHGIPTNSFLFRDVIDRIAEERRVIVPDMLGYGNSAMSDNFDRSIRAQEEMITDLLSSLGLDKVSLVGHDLGGGVFLRYAIHNPGAVEKLVLSNSIQYDSWPVQFVTDTGLPDTAHENTVEEMQENLEEIFRDTLYREDVREEFLEGMKAPWNSEEGLTSLVRCAIATNTNHTTEVDPAEVDAETLLLWGAEDDFQPIEFAERLEEDIDDTELVGLEANHWVLEDRPERCREELAEFLL